MTMAVFVDVNGLHNIYERKRVDASAIACNASFGKSLVSADGCLVLWHDEYVSCHVDSHNENGIGVARQMTQQHGTSYHAYVWLASRLWSVGQSVCDAWVGGLSLSNDGWWLHLRHFISLLTHMPPPSSHTRSPHTIIHQTGSQ
jgi:hypothetical protein